MGGGGQDSGLMSTARFAIVMLTAASFACGPAAAPVASGSPVAAATPSTSARPTASQSPSTTPLATADLPILIGTTDGHLRRLRGDTWQSVAAPCAPDPVNRMSISGDGTIVVVQCFRRAGTGSGLDEMVTFAYETRTSAIRPLPPMHTNGIGPLAFDGGVVVAQRRGDCPMPAPVCQTKWSFLDTRSGAWTELLPSDYWLDTELRWPLTGLVYYRPICASAGCVDEDKAGTFAFDGSTWRKISPDRLVDSDPGRNAWLLERDLRRSTGRITLRERVGGSETELTPASVAKEYAIAFVDDRAFAWRPGASETDGSIIEYQNGREVRAAQVAFGRYGTARSGQLLVGFFLAGAPTWTAYVYDTATRRSRSLHLPGAGAFVVLPP